MPVMRVCVRACAWYCVDSGMLADLGSNVKRAVQNNFADVYRQRVIDMVHGQETVGAKAHSRIDGDEVVGLVRPREPVVRRLPHHGAVLAASHMHPQARIGGEEKGVI